MCIRPSWTGVGANALRVFEEAIGPASRQTPELAASGLDFVRVALREYKSVSAAAEITNLEAAATALRTGTGGLDNALDGVAGIARIKTALLTDLGPGDPRFRGMPTMSAELERLVGCGSAGSGPDSLAAVERALAGV
jgi:hypothetical protein